MFKVRGITAVCLLGLGFTLWQLPDEVVQIFFNGVLLLLGWEWAALIGIQSKVRRLGYSAWMSFLVYGLSSFLMEPLNLGLCVGLCLALIPWIASYPKARFFKYQTPAYFVFWGFLGVWLLGTFKESILYLFAQESLLPFHHAWFLFLGASVAFADIGAYLVGRVYGKTSLLPRVSPGKTVEGLLGGFLTLAVWFIVSAPFFRPAGCSIGQWAVLGVGLFILSVMGDLLESILKREAQVKDSGFILPGHGGILDRLDSWIPTSIFLSFVMKFIYE